MKLCAVVMKIRSLSFALVICLGVALVSAAQGTPAISPQSLAGDWEYAVTPQLKLVLHLRVDARGALSGTIDTPDTPPKHIELTNFKLAGKMLSYTMGSQPGSITEVISADGTKMLGAYMWTKVGASGAPAITPPFVPLAQIAGDWVTPGGGASAQVLRLRLGASGALTGTIDAPEPMTQRLPLSNVQVTGRTLSYTMPDGARTYQGTFSNDGKMVTPTGQSTIDATWQHTRTAAQAAAQEAAQNSNPINGDWSGVTHNVATVTIVKPDHDTVHLTFHFKSDPVSCTMDSPEQGGAAGIPCTMTESGSKVHVDSLRSLGGTFDGTLSADGNHLIGTWKVGAAWQWGPMEMDMMRTAPAAH
ncbi:MAG: hypothetical protein ACLPZY_06735 [Terracidiphilus sp.]